MKLSLEISVSYRSGLVKGTLDFYAGMVQGRFIMASRARRLFQISDRNNNGKNSAGLTNMGALFGKICGGPTPPCDDQYCSSLTYIDISPRLLL
jgi:hypothetical protein